jgi:hypothetical protein
MRWASPSAMAVLPTPGSPTSTGLFLVRRPKICTTRSISRCAHDRVNFASGSQFRQVSAKLCQNFAPNAIRHPITVSIGHWRARRQLRLVLE